MLNLTEHEVAELKEILDRVLNQQFVANTAPAHRLRMKIADLETLLNEPVRKIISPEELDFWAVTNR